MSPLTSRRLLTAGLAAAIVAIAPAPAAGQNVLAPSLVVDTPFSPPDGIARVDLAGNLTDIPSGVAVDGQRIYTVGEARDTSSNSDIGIVAHRTDGTLDPEFSGDGKLVVPIAADTGKDVGVSVLVLPDRSLRILASTDVTAGSGTNIDVAVIGLTATGEFDTTFGGGDGQVTFPVGTHDDTPTRMVAGPDGRLAISGARRDAASKEDSFVALLEPDGSPVASFGTAGVRILDRAGPTLNDRAVDIAFRPGGALVALIQNETNPDAAVNDYQTVLHAFDITGADDLGFSEDADHVLAVGDPDTIPGGLIAHDGRLWAVGSTKVGQDTDAYLARMNGDGSGVEFRRFDMRGTAIQPTQQVISAASELAVVPGNPLTLVVMGSVNYGSRPYWAGAAFNRLSGPVESFGYGDLIIPTEEYGAVVGAVPGGDGWVAVAGSLVNTSENFDTSFGTARVLVDADKACDVTVSVPRPLEIGIAPGATAPVTLKVDNVGTRPCSGVVTVPPEYTLRSGRVDGPASFGGIDPGGSVQLEAELGYTGPRRLDDTVTFTVQAPGDARPTNDTRRVHVLFEFCDLRMAPIDSPSRIPDEGGIRVEFNVRNVGTLDCRNLRLGRLDSGGWVPRTSRFTLRRGRSASETMRVGAPAGSAPGASATVTVVPRADRLANEADDAVELTATVVGVGDSKVTSATSRRFRGAARPGRASAGQRLKVERVEVAITRAGKRCAWAKRSGKLVRRGCKRPVWLKARGKRAWSLALARSLPAGKYVVRSRAVVQGGFAEARFSSKDGNRRSFTVR